MPSLDHELHVELFRQAPVLALELLRACAGIDLAGEAELASADLSQVTPTEFRADAVVVVRGPDRAPVTGVVVEVQITRDPDKRRTWPLYVTALRASLDCPVLLLVVAPDPRVAESAREPIATGHPGFTLVPIVISHEDIPRLTGGVMVPELAVLSAVAHPEAAVARAALAHLPGLPAELRALYCDYVLNALPDLIRHALEVEMTPERMIEVSKQLRAQVNEKLAYDVGKREGREEGRRTVVLEVLTARFGASAQVLAARIEALTGEPLAALVTTVATAPDLDAVVAQIAALEPGAPAPG